MKIKREQEEMNEVEKRKAENGEEKWTAASKWKREEEEREKNGLKNGKEENSKEEWIAASKLKREEEEQKLNGMGKRRGEDEMFRGEMEEEEKIAASKFTCFEDVLEVVGSRDRWNVGLLFLCASPTFLLAFVSMSYQFLGTTPDHWCHVEVLRDANWTHEQILHLAIPFSNQTGQHSGCSMYDYNYTKAAMLGYDAALTRLDDLTDHSGAPEVVPCSTRDFSRTQHESSIVTEWDLVCERRVLYATTQAVNQLGFLFGYILGSIFTDAFGRRPVSLAMIFLSFLLGTGSCVASSAEVFLVLRCCLSATGSALYLSSFLIVMELCSPSTRTPFSCMFVMFWALGIMVLPGVAYLVRPWRHLQAALTLPYGVLLVSYWVLPESPRWLLLKGRNEDAEATLMRIASANRRQMLPRRVLRAALKRVAQQMTGDSRGELGVLDGKTGQQVAAAVRHLLSPYSTTTLALRMGLLFVLWFSVSFVYYGIALNATNISADPYLYLFLGGMCELPAYLLLWPLAAHAGRRPSLSGLYLLCAACIAANAALMFTTPDVSVAIKISLSLVSKMGIAAAFHLLYLYTAELFTTQQRSLAVGHNSFCGRIGSIISPYVNDLLGERAAWAPSAAFSGMALLSATLALLLPETRNQNLPEDDQRRLPATSSEEESRRPLRDAPADC